MRWAWKVSHMKIAKAGSVRLFALVTDAYGGVGGIALYNRDVLGALCSFSGVSEVVCLPRLADHPVGETPAKLNYNLGGLGGKARYAINAVMAALTAGPVDIVYCAHVNLVPIARLISLLKRAPLVLAIYGIEAWAPPPRKWQRGLLRHVALVLSISEVTRDRFLAWAPVSTDRIAIMPNAIRLKDYGVAEKDAALLERYGLAGKRVLLTLGRMNPAERYKGFDELIEALPGLDPDIVYVAAGDGADRPRLEARARDMGVAGRVVFTGQIDEATKTGLYRLADAYVMPSTGEGFGFVVLEALACGTPVMASRTDGTREAVRDGALGLLVNPTDKDEVREGILKTLKAPRGVPAGLEYFEYAQFADRLKTAISRVCQLEGAK